MGKETESRKRKRKTSLEEIKKQGEKIKQDFKKVLDKGKKIFKEKKDAIADKLKQNKEIRNIKKQIDKVRKVDENTKYLKLLDRLLFTYGLLSLFTCFGLMFYPKISYLAYYMVVKNFILLVYRFIDWKPKKWHYYYFDFCYWCNFLSWFYVLVRPHDKVVFTILFFNATGPMLNYFILLKAKLIFQNNQSLTGFIMHYLPGIFVMRLRWYNTDTSGPFPLSEAFDEMVAGAGWRGQAKFFLMGFAFYAAWYVMYYVMVFFVLNKRIKTRGNETMYFYLISVVKSFNGFIFSLGEKWAPEMYSLLHLTQGLIGCTVSLIFMNSRVLSIVGIYFYCFFPVWYGSKYYFDYFTAEYQTKLEQRAEKNKLKRIQKEALRKSASGDSTRDSSSESGDTDSDRHPGDSYYQD